MPNLPMPSVSPHLARGNAPGINMNADPNAFGASVGRAIQGAGQEIDNAGARLWTYEERKRKEKVANAAAQFDFTPDEVAIRGKMGAGADGYRDAVLTRYRERVEEEANKIDDDSARMEFRRSMLEDERSVSSRAALYEEAQATEFSKKTADASIFALENKITSDPENFDKYVSQGQAVLATRPGMTATQISAMQQQFSQNATKARFVGLLENATSPEDVDGVIDELSDPDAEWQGRMHPEDYKWTINAAQTRKASMMNLSEARARAAIDTLDTRNNDQTIISQDELRLVAQEVKSSGDPILMGRFARIQRDQQLIAEYKGASPAELDAATNRAGGELATSLPPSLSVGVNNAVRRFNVSASYLAAMISRESGGDANAKNPSSSATGLTQFIDSTWLGILKDGVTAERMGVNVSGMSDADLLALRTDPNISIMMGAAYAEQNANYLQQATGRVPSEADLYLAHFLGPEGAATMLNADPNASAASVNPAAAGSNRGVFYYGKGEPKTVQQLRNDIARKFGQGPSEVAYGDVQTLDKINAATKTVLDTDPMTFAQESGKFDVQPLSDAGSYQARAASARAAADYYNIPMSEFKPLTAAEVNQISEQLGTSKSDETAAILANVQQLGGDVAKAAFKQLGQKDPVYAFAAGLAAEGGSAPASLDVIRGRKRLEDNPALKEGIGSPAEVSQMFARITGGALMDVAADQRQAIQDAALAHYAETVTARGGAGLTEQGFGASVQAVLGGSADAPVLANVNGAPTALPPGISADAMNKAIDNMTVADWTMMSPQKTPPRFVNGDVASAEELAAEAKLRSVGGGMYKIMFDDGTYAVTGVLAPGGRYEAYLFQPTPDAISAVVDQGAAAGPYGSRSDETVNVDAMYGSRPAPLGGAWVME